MKSENNPGTNPDLIVQIKDGKLRQYNPQILMILHDRSGIFLGDQVKNDSDYLTEPIEDIPLAS